MNVRTAKKLLLPVVGGRNISNTLTMLSHWVNAVKSGPKNTYKSDDPKDFVQIKRMQEWGIIKITKEGNDKMEVQLTDSGRELYSDFFKKGYYQ